MPETSEEAMAPDIESVGSDITQPQLQPLQPLQSLQPAGALGGHVAHGLWRVGPAARRFLRRCCLVTLVASGVGSAVAVALTFAELLGKSSCVAVCIDNGKDNAYT